MREPNCSPRGPRLYGHREERKQACREVLRAEDPVAIAVQLEDEHELPVAGRLFCTRGGMFCRQECCNPDWTDPEENEIPDFYYDD